MKNKYLINFSKKFWFWFWKKLMDGFAPSDIYGNYKRPKGIFIEKTNSFETYNEQIFLLVGDSCPWCHRTLIVHNLKNLSNSVKIIFLKADINSGQWIFNKKFKGCKTLVEFYKKAHRYNIFRSTLPLLVSFEDDQLNILSSESNQIVKLMNSIKKESKTQSPQINTCNQKLLNLIHSDINNGVYKCGFARNQSSYESASQSLFKALKRFLLAFS